MYAAELAEVLPHHPRSAWREVAPVLATLIGGRALPTGLYALDAGGGGARALVRLAVGLTLWAAVGAGLLRQLRRQDDCVPDPRDGHEMAGPSPRWLGALRVAAPCVALTAAFLLGLAQR